MKRLTTYTENDYTINLGDLFTIGDTVIIIKELFILNDIVYVSSDDNSPIGSGFLIESANKFINDKKDYFDTVTTAPSGIKDGCCNCED